MCNRKVNSERGALWMQLKNPLLLKQLMEMKGISARRLAALAGWKSHTYLSRLLHGQVSTLETDPALRIAFALDVPVDALFLTKMARNTGQNAREASERMAA